jgi:SAM-dependent methyltransferase
MYLDVVDLRDFYATLLGRVVRRAVGSALADLRRQSPGQRILGFGFATPYLDPGAGSAERILAFMPAGQGVIDWPQDRPSATALVDEDLLPLPDGSVDSVLMIHALEMSPRPHALMDEVRRVLSHGGILITAVPNRQSPWARSDLSPFGFGRPYSRRQLRDLLTGAGFEAEAWTTALHMPPTERQAILGAWGALDRLGRAVWPAFSGVMLVRAVKRTVQGTRVRVRPSFAHAFRPALRPSPGLIGRSRP